MSTNLYGTISEKYNVGSDSFNLIMAEITSLIDTGEITQEDVDNYPNGEINAIVANLLSKYDIVYQGEADGSESNKDYQKKTDNLMTIDVNGDAIDKVVKYNNRVIGLPNKPVRIGAIGDSITRNQIDTTDVSWGKRYVWYGRNWLLRTGMKLNGKGWVDIYAVEGYSGMRTDEILDLMLPPGSVINPTHVTPQPVGVLSIKPDIVIELTGTNDNYFEINTKEQMVAGRRAIWERLIAHGITPVALSMLPNDLTDHRNIRVQEWNEAVKEEAEKLGVVFVDIYKNCSNGTKWKTGFNWNNGVPDVIGGLHPGAEACEQISIDLADALNAIIGTRINTPTVMANLPLYSKAHNETLKNEEYKLFSGDNGLFTNVGSYTPRYENTSGVSTRSVVKDETFTKFGNVLTIDYNQTVNESSGYTDTVSSALSVTPGDIHGVFFKYEFIAKNNDDGIQVGISFNEDYNNLITFFTGGSGNKAASTPEGNSISGVYYQEIVIPNNCNTIHLFMSLGTAIGSVNKGQRIRISNVGTVKIRKNVLSTFGLMNIPNKGTLSDLDYWKLILSHEPKIKNEDLPKFNFKLNKDNDVTMAFIGDSTTWQSQVAMMPRLISMYRGSVMGGKSRFLNFGASGQPLSHLLSTPPSNSFILPTIDNPDFNFNGVRLNSFNGANGISDYLKSNADLYIISMGINDVILNSSVGNLPENDLINYIKDSLVKLVKIIYLYQPDANIVLRIPNEMSSRPLNVNYPSTAQYPTFGSNLNNDIALVTKWNNALRKGYHAVDLELKGSILLYDVFKEYLPLRGAGVEQGDTIGKNKLLADLVHPSLTAYSASGDGLISCLTGNDDKIGFKITAEAQAAVDLVHPSKYYAGYFNNDTEYYKFKFQIVAIGTNYIDISINEDQYNKLINNKLDLYFLLDNDVVAKQSNYYITLIGQNCRFLNVTFPVEYSKYVGKEVVIIQEKSIAKINTLTNLTKSLEEAVTLTQYNSRSSVLMGYVKALHKVNRGDIVNYKAVSFLDSIAGWSMYSISGKMASSLGNIFLSYNPSAGSTNIPGNYTYPVQAILLHGVTGGTLTTLNDKYDRWFTGDISVISNGSTNELNRSGGKFYFTSVTVCYLVKAGGGTIQMYKDDVAVGSVVDTSLGTIGEIKFLEYTHTQGASKNKITYTVTGGDVEIVYQYYEDNRKSNFMLYPLERGGLGIESAMSTVMGRNNLAALLNRIQPNLATYDSKETNVTMSANLPLLLNILDASSDDLDVILCGSTPIANNIPNTQDQLLQNKFIADTVKAKALQHKRYYYIDKMLPFSIDGDVTTAYDHVMALGAEVYGDGIHYTALGVEIANSGLTRLINESEIFYGYSGKPVNSPVVPSKFAIGSEFYGENSSLFVGAETGGYHWFMEFLYSFYLKDKSGNKAFQIATGGGKNSILPGGYKIGSETATQNIYFNNDYYQFKDDNATTSPTGFLKVEAGMFKTYWTREQLLTIPAQSNIGAMCFCVNAAGGPAIVYARGNSPTDWVKVKDDSEI